MWFVGSIRGRAKYFTYEKARKSKKVLTASGQSGNRAGRQGNSATGRRPQPIKKMTNQPTPTLEVTVPSDVLAVYSALVASGATAGVPADHIVLRAAPMLPDSADDLYGNRSRWELFVTLEGASTTLNRTANGNWFTEDINTGIFSSMGDSPVDVASRYFIG